MTQPHNSMDRPADSVSASLLSEGRFRGARDSRPTLVSPGGRQAWTFGTLNLCRPPD